VRSLVARVIFLSQIVLLHCSYWVFSFVISSHHKAKKDWAVGVDEVAANVHNISSALRDAVSVSMTAHPFYAYKYDHSFPALIAWRPIRYLTRIFYAPILLGYLCHQVRGFFYVAGAGYLVSELDGRNYEFRFLKARGVRIVCFFCGSEIRSHQLMNQLSEQMGRDLISTYQTIAVPGFDANHLEVFRKKLAASADRYADHIFNAPVDQISYIRRDVHPFIYFYPGSSFIRNEAKFTELSRVRVVHGPSSPLIKGTPLVRAAVKKLQLEGYDFEYRELIGVSNHDMLEALNKAHVVLNEFYALVPGQFGVEAMASHCALMTSADEKIETSLPKGANSAWMVTEYWNVYDNLKRLLDDHSLIKQYADAGFIWAYENCSYQNSAAKMRNILNS
jgi:hypothetical protein